MKIIYRNLIINLFNYKIHLIMKRTLQTMTLALVLLIAGNLTGQSMNQSVAQGKTKAMVQPVDLDVNQSAKPNTVLEHDFSKSSAPGVLVGLTYYDLQSNGSIDNRIINHGDGRVTVAWTMSIEGGGFPDRGTGRNSFDGTQWEFSGPAQLGAMERLEPSRCGWPSIGETESGRQFAVAHYAGIAAGDLEGVAFSWRDSAEDEWQTKNIVDSDLQPNVINDSDLTWIRVAVSGNTIHLVGSHFSGDGTFNWNGVRGGLHYMRSTDAGDTWETVDAEEFKAPNIGSIGGDAYAIHVVGETVAIVGGDYAPILWKSTDAGSTWTVTNILGQNPLAGGFDLATQLEGNRLRSDGTYDLILGADGTAHCFWGRSMTSYDADADGVIGGRFFPQTMAGIMYWNDAAGVPARTIGKTCLQDLDGDMLPPVQFIDGNLPDLQTAGNGMSSFPSCGMDAAGNLYMVYTSIVEGDVDNEGRLYRDAYAVKSTDGGVTFEGPVNLTNSPGEEITFAALAKLVDEDMHILFQSDPFTGLNVGGDPANPTQSDMTTNEEMRYMTFDPAAVVTPAIQNSTAPVWTPNLVPLQVGVGCDQTINLSENLFWDAWDYPEGDLTSSIEVSPNAFASEATMVAIVYSLEDADGNVAHGGDNTVPAFWVPESPFEVDSIDVVADITPPVMLLVGEPEITILVDSGYEDPGVLVGDQEDGNGCGNAIDNLVFNDGGYDISVPADYLLTWNVTDPSGNAAPEVSRLIHVIGEDTSPPTLDLFDPVTGAPITSAWTVQGSENGDFIPPNFEVDDDISILTGDDVVVTGTVNTAELGDYVVTYSITDVGGNTTEIPVTISVVDNILPILIYTGDSPLALTCDADWQAIIESELNLSDNMGATNLTLSYPGDVVMTDCDSAMPYSITMIATDESGNESSAFPISITVTGCAATCGEGIADDIFDSNLTLAPNPTSGFVTIQLGTASAVNVEVYDVQGRLIAPASNFELGESISLDLSNQLGGVYLVKISSDDAVAYRRVMLKK
ncbi:DUF5011 domain-containing protein [Chitinophagales bacterium]|nr:DUF5011 domain-containing protein [Chitinophagales bacterium]